MEGDALTGYYDYRSFLHDGLLTSDPNAGRFVQAELFLILQDDGTASGTLSFQPEPGASENLIIDINGNLKIESSLMSRSVRCLWYCNKFIHKPFR